MRSCCAYLRPGCAFLRSCCGFGFCSNGASIHQRSTQTMVSARIIGPTPPKSCYADSSWAICRLESRATWAAEHLCHLHTGLIRCGHLKLQLRSFFKQLLAERVQDLAPFWRDPSSKLVCCASQRCLHLACRSCCTLLKTVWG